MTHAEYLVSFGLAGDFGRFRTAEPLSLRRGSRVVIRGDRGLELGQVLRPATERHGRFMPDLAAGELLRPASPADEEQSLQMQQRAALLLRRAGEWVEQRGSPVALLDAEVLLDGRHAVLQVLRWGECDLRELVRPLSVELDLAISLAEL